MSTQAHTQASTVLNQVKSNQIKSINHEIDQSSAGGVKSSVAQKLILHQMERRLL
jgi:hypothetical protein